MQSVKLITIIKNRLNHFLKTFPFMVSQYGLEYELLIVDFYSTDGFQDYLLEEIKFRKDSFSPYLKKITCVRDTTDEKFSTKKAKNLGAIYCSKKDTLAFSDVDVFLGMDYLHHWIPKVKKGETFVATRRKDTRASLPERLKPEINYGNLFVHAEDYYKVEGFDESILHWGGADDDIFHRLKLLGLHEINPHDSVEAKQYSILHGDDLRLELLEDTERYDKESLFNKIFSNKDRIQSRESCYLNLQRALAFSKDTVLYEK